MKRTSRWLGPVLAVGFVTMAASGSALAVDGAKGVPHHQQGSLDKASKDSPLTLLGFDKRFFKKGDSWTVAWSFRKRNWIRKVGHSKFKDAAVIFSEPQSVTYRVVDVYSQRLGKAKRQIARISAKWDKEALGQLHKEAVLSVDQNMNPVTMRVKTRGQIGFQRRDIDTRKEIQGIGLIPFYVPKMTNPVGRDAWAPVPALPRQFAKVRPVTKPGTRALALKVTTNGEYRARTFWVPGNLYAAYVGGPHVVGVLTAQTKAR
ncbi:MAG: hypothetical protein HYY84_07630 [Deltaproteobacteria bacterium]|nr:hypothetical protein [Deltaproteobacteria bacterium]